MPLQVVQNGDAGGATVQVIVAQDGMRHFAVPNGQAPGLYQAAVRTRQPQPVSRVSMPWTTAGSLSMHRTSASLKFRLRRCEAGFVARLTGPRAKGTSIAKQLPRPGRGSHRYPVTQDAGQPLHDAEAQAQPLAALGRRVVQLAELDEDVFQLVLRDADARCPRPRSEVLAAFGGTPAAPARSRV